MGKSDRVRALIFRALAGLIVAILFAGESLQAYAGFDPAPEPDSGSARYTFYVAPNGNDAWSGKSATAAGNDGPFATLTRARDAIRALKSAGRLDGPVFVYLRGGTYRLTKPFTINPDDSGTAAAPVVYAAYNNETPVITGGERITGWSKFRGGNSAARGKLWVASVPAGWTFNELFWNGEWLQRSAMNPGNRWEEWPRASGGNGAELVFPAGVVGPWPDLSSAEVNIMDTPVTRWANMLVPVKGPNPSKGSLILDGTQSVAPLSAAPPWGIRQGEEFRIENALEVIYVPGQWSVDAKAGKVYLWPPDGTDPNSADIEAPRIHTAIGIGGQGKQGVVRYVTLRGLTITVVGRRRLNDAPPPGGFDNFVSNDAAVLFWGAEDCNIERCRIINVGGAGVRAIKHAARLRIENSEIANCGGDGIRLQGNGPGHQHTTRDVLVRGNHIHHIAKVFFYGAGVRLSMVGNTAIEQNNIHDSMGMGIGVFGMMAVNFQMARRDVTAAQRYPMKMSTWDMDVNWATLGADPLTIESVRRFVPGHVLIADDTIHDVMEADDDSGAIYLWAGGPGDEIRHNRIYRTHKPMSAGIYLDAEQCDTLVRDNIVTECPMVPARRLGSLFLNVNGRNQIENNIFAYSNRLFQFLRSHGGHRIFHNIFLFNAVNSPPEPVESPTGAAKHPSPRGLPLFGTFPVQDPGPKGPSFGPSEMDYNLYWSSAGGAPLQGFLARWREMGFDRHSLLQGPGFANPRAGDYHLAPNSPALKIGFKPIE